MKFQSDNPADHKGVIQDMMNLATIIVNVYKKILDVTEGDKPISAVYVADGIYASVLTDQEPYRVAFYDFTVSPNPFFIIGEKTYHPISDGKDGIYFYPFVSEALYAFYYVLVKRMQVDMTKSPDLWDWDNSPRVLIAMHHAWVFIKYRRKGQPTMEMGEMAMHGDWFGNGKHQVCRWIYDETTDRITATWDAVELNGRDRTLCISYNGHDLSPVSVDWGEHLKGDTMFNTLMSGIPFSPAWH